jgi:hypothetical protein
MARRGFEKIEGLYDSHEELYFSWWTNELINAGYIKAVIPQPEPFVLFDGYNCTYEEKYKRKEGYKAVEESLLREHTWTTDVLIEWDKSAEGLFYELQDSANRKKKGSSLNTILAKEVGYMQPKHISYIEIKPSFDKHNMTKFARLNQQWTFQLHNIYVNIIVPEKHFKKTFTPQRFFYTNATNSKKERKIKYSPAISLQEYLLKKEYQ